MYLALSFPLHVCVKRHRPGKGHKKNRVAPGLPAAVAEGSWVVHTVHNTGGGIGSELGKAETARSGKKSDVRNRRRIRRRDGHRVYRDA